MFSLVLIKVIGVRDRSSKPYNDVDISVPREALEQEYVKKEY